MCKFLDKLKLFQLEMSPKLNIPIFSSMLLKHCAHSDILIIPTKHTSIRQGLLATKIILLIPKDTA